MPDVAEASRPPSNSSALSPAATLTLPAVSWPPFNSRTVLLSTPAPPSPSVRPFMFQWEPVSLTDTSAFVAEIVLLALVESRPPFVMFTTLSAAPPKLSALALLIVPPLMLRVWLLPPPPFRLNVLLRSVSVLPSLTFSV